MKSTKTEIEELFSKIKWHYSFDIYTLGFIGFIDKKYFVEYKADKNMFSFGGPILRELQNNCRKQNSPLAYSLRVAIKKHFGIKVNLEEIVVFDGYGINKKDFITSERSYLRNVERIFFRNKAARKSVFSS